MPADASTELCGRCGCVLRGHNGRPCTQTINGEKCQCPSGVRTDVFLCGQIGTLIRMHKQLIDQNNDLFTLLCFVHGVEIGPNGEIKKKVQLTL